MTTEANTLQHFFPRTSHPLICNAPMAGATNAELAVAVTKAGGLGFIGGGADFTPSSKGFNDLSLQLTEARHLLEIKDPSTTLPIGIGCLTMNSHSWIKSFIQLIKQHRPIAVWLFAYTHRWQHTKLIEALHAAGCEWSLKVIVQVGTVKSAQEAIDDGADVLSVQGSDAGGHQFAKGASLMTLLPDVLDLLRIKYPENTIPLLAAGGIMDGKGVAAALLLGASGVVMGTKFLCTKECPISDDVKNCLVATQDGASSTLKSRIHDELQGNLAFWPDQYSGRAVISETHQAASSCPNEQNPPKADKEVPLIVWAGAGIGQIRSVSNAGSVVIASRKQAKNLIRHFKI